MDIKIIAILVTVAAAIGFTVGQKYGTSPAKAIINTAEKQINQTNIITQTKQLKRPDGTVETIILTTDKSTKTETKSTNTQITASPAKNWKLGAATTVFGDGLYQISLSRRILGDIFIDVHASISPQLDNKQVMLGVSYEF